MKSGDKVVVRKADGTEGTATFTSKDGKTFNIDNKSVFVAGHGDMTAHHNAMKTDETFDATSYEINPANIGEKFKDQKIMVRTAKPDSK